MLNVSDKKELLTPPKVTLEWIDHLIQQQRTRTLAGIKVLTMHSLTWHMGGVWPGHQSEIMGAPGETSNRYAGASIDCGAAGAAQRLVCLLWLKSEHG